MSKSKRCNSLAVLFAVFALGCAAVAQTNAQKATFDYVDATNLATPDSGHMQNMILTVLDENRHTEEWVFVDHGKEHTQVFDLRRKA